MNPYHSVTEIQADIRAGRLSMVQLVHYYLDRIRSNKHLNAFIEVYEEETVRKAAELDKRFQSGKTGKLAGMVIGIKDMICYKDHKISASSGILHNFVSLYSATVVERALKEDALIIGRLNCDEFAMGASNETSVYGPVLNYADNTRVPGGSSGGSAVAVQADMCLASLGTDTGGSVRQPASFCGVIGLKPTYGRVSRHGVIAYASSFDQVGPVTKSIDDMALLLEVIAGRDEFDSTASSLQVPAFSGNLKRPEGVKVAYLQETLESEGLDPEIRDEMQRTIDRLKNEGHIAEPVHFPYLKYVVPTYYILTTAEASSNFSRYDGVHFGYRSPNASTLESTYKKSRTEGFGTEVKRRIMLGTFVLSAGYYDAYYAKAQRVRRLIRDKSLEILDKYDYILLPTAPTTAFGLGEKTDDPIVMYLADIFTVQASLAGLPAISLPMGQHSNGLPFGLQLIGRRFEEQNMLSFSKYLLDQN